MVIFKVVIYFFYETNKITFPLLKIIFLGDLDNIKKLLLELCVPNCSLLTAALDKPLYGLKYVIDFFEVLMETHPDGVLVAKKTRGKKNTLKKQLNNNINHKIF